MPRPLRGRSRPPTSRVHARSAETAKPPAITPEAEARRPELLALADQSDIAAQFGALADETPGGALALVQVLGGSRDEAAGIVLSALAASAPEREARKAARGALHRLKSAGVALAVAVPVEPAAPPAAPVEVLPPSRALVSPSDGVGSRLLWLLVERPLGGATTFCLAINDVVGLKNVMVEETTRRRFERRQREWNETNERSSVDVPVEYGLALLSEVLALNAESSFPLPRDFVLRRGLLGELPPPPAAALIHQHISRGQTFLMPNLLDESGRLLEGEPELLGWVFGYAEVSTYARDYRQAGESSLLLSSEPPERRQARIMGEAIDALFTPQLRRAFRRRLEETAYIFWATDRERSARQAVAAAFAITDTGSLRSHPLLQAIVARSVELAIEVDRSGLPLPAGANRTAYTPI